MQATPSTNPSSQINAFAESFLLICYLPLVICSTKFRDKTGINKQKLSRCLFSFLAILENNLTIRFRQSILSPNFSSTSFKTSSNYRQACLVVSLNVAFQAICSRDSSISTFKGKYSNDLLELFKLADLNNRINPRQFPIAVSISLNLSNRLLSSQNRCIFLISL